MLRLIIALSFILNSVASFAQAEHVLSKSGCATKKMRETYNNKSQITGTPMNGTIIMAENSLLTNSNRADIKFTMERGMKYTIAVIFDRDPKKKMSPHTAAWGTVNAGSNTIEIMNRKEGTDLFFELPIQNTNADVTLNMRGTVYYDPRDASKQQDVCAIVYVVKKPAPVGQVYGPFVLKPSSKETPTSIPETVPANRIEVFRGWEQAKTKLTWQWLEEKIPHLSKMFRGTNYMVAHTGSGNYWTQALMSYKPFPAYWNYEASFFTLRGNKRDMENGLMLTATYEGQSYKLIFTVNTQTQHWYFGQYNVKTDKWTNLKDGYQFSNYIRKETSADFSTNRLSLYREGKEVVLYINSEEVARFNTDEYSILNYLTGIGITGNNEGAFYVDDPFFWMLQD